MQRQRGAPVFFSVLSKAQTFKEGSLDRFSDTVTRKGVSDSCLRCVMDASAASEARKLRTTLRARERTRTEPSEVPRKRESEPVVNDTTSFCKQCQAEGHMAVLRRTSKIYDPSSSAGTGTCETLKKGNSFQLVSAMASHTMELQVKAQEPMAARTHVLGLAPHRSSLNAGTRCGAACLPCRHKFGRALTHACNLPT